ncbi:MAG TPA: sugar transferase [Candidatus Acidoferrum sp.]|nr:sugar transferase [Candidatus Acidoferrum sp.]
MKRAMDVMLAAAVLVLSSPLMALIAALIRVRLGRPVFFRQLRIGLRDRPFRIWKFRTMTERVDARGRLLPDSERLTSLGRVLRRSSLDELPQLWNVLRGEMSLIGPRPLLPQYLPRYSMAQRRRHEVQPGITGWAQVNGRNALSWERRFQLDVWYVDHRSLWLDLRILWMTVDRLVRPRGISGANHATMPEFLGTPEQVQP